MSGPLRRISLRCAYLTPVLVKDNMPGGEEALGFRSEAAGADAESPGFPAGLSEPAVHAGLSPSSPSVPAHAMGEPMN